MRIGCTLLAIFLLSLPLAYASEESSKIYNSEYLDLGLNITGGIKIMPERSDYDIDYISASLSFYPKDDLLQTVTGFSTYPESEVSEGNIIFRWDNPREQYMTYYAESNLSIYNKMTHFSEKIPFPVEDLPKDIKAYTLPSSYIDSDNKEVIKKATELVSGEDDMFVAVYKLASFTKENIEYDISSVTADASQKSSWVLENRRGVCDELTNLFIGMCRSVGIPARFVSGISYTNSELFLEPWGSHGWAEVYFPGIGWVPFDVTYGEFGYVDASHIKLLSSRDSNESSVSYEWLSNNVALQTIPLKFETSIVGAHGTLEDMFEADVDILDDSIGFGSYNLVEVTITNPTDYYLSADILISNTEGLEIDGNSRNVLLLPKGTEKVFWTIKVDKDLSSRYVYTFPMTVYTQRGTLEDIEFKSEKGSQVYSLAEIESYIAQKEIIKERSYEYSASLNCSADDFYAYEEGHVDCAVKNTGNMPLDYLTLCVDSSCSVFSLGLSNEKEVRLNMTLTDPGEYQKTVYLKGSFNSLDSVNFTMYDEPFIGLSNLTYDYVVKYGNTTRIYFELERTSFSIPKSVEIILSNDFVQQRWNLSEFYNDKGYVVDIDSSDLSRENHFTLLVNYFDDNGKRYSFQREFDMQLDRLTPQQSLQVKTKDIMRSMERNRIFSTIMVAAIIFIIVMLIVWKSRKRDRELELYKYRIKRESEKEFRKQIEEEQEEDEKIFKKPKK